MRTDFAALIQTHGRADAVLTVEALRSHGYTGRIIIMIDTEDASASRYKARFGEVNVITFDKASVDVDTCMPSSQSNRRRCVAFARNASFIVAQSLGLKYFTILDDDYREFSFRFSSSHAFKWTRMADLDSVFAALVDFLEATPVKSVAMSQNGDWIGGAASTHASSITLWRKLMNSFVCATDRPFEFRGRLNEDVNCYVENGSRGDLFFTANFVSLAQVQTQLQSGGVQYEGTYTKSFVTVMIAPSCVSISTMGETAKRIHHRIDWKGAVPMLIRASHKKGV